MRSKSATAFECTACGHRSSKWLGRCPGCGGWNTLEAVPEKPRSRSGREAAAPVPVTAADLGLEQRPSTGLAGVDRVLGGGLVPGSAVLLAGEPGVGKSTLLLQVAAHVAATGPVLYVTAEESPAQVADRARRLGCVDENLLLLPEPCVEAAVSTAASARPGLVVVDSVQTMLSERVPSVPGSISQVREVAAQIVEFAKRTGTPAILVGHVTKEGVVAGPRSLEHLVDVLLDFSGATTHVHRTLRTLKNRFGPTLELALFAMHGDGLEEIGNPSSALLADRTAGAAGSAVAVVMEGTTPLLVEVQALVSRSALANPRRVAQGADPGRIALLLAVLEKRAGVRLGDRDVFLNVVGGFAVDEPALDVAAAAAVLSSAADRPLPDDLALFGEVGLLGEVRAVSRPAERVREAAALGFQRCGVPASTPDKAGVDGVALVKVTDVGDLASFLTGATTP